MSSSVSIGIAAVVVYLVILALTRAFSGYFSAARKKSSAARQLDGATKQTMETPAVPLVSEAPARHTVEPVVLAANEPPLATQLHQLADALGHFAASSAHPRELREHADFQHAVTLLAGAATPLDVVMQYALGANWPLSCAALAALAERNDSSAKATEVMAQFDRLCVWAMYFALAYSLRVDPRPPAGACVAGAKDWWRDNGSVLQIFQEHFDRRAALRDAAEFGPALQPASAAALATIRAFLDRLNHPFAAKLVARLDEIQRSQVDRAFLATFGQFWGEEAEVLVVPPRWEAPLKVAQSTFARPVAQSLLVSGEQLAGKTAFLRLLAGRLKEQGWTVFEASGADLMAGQIWFGQLEGRLRRATEEITVAKKLIWYIPDLLQLARSGTHQGQSASVLDQILPAIVSGRMVVWTEASPSAAARLLQTRPALRSLVEVIRLDPESEDSTLALARALIERLSSEPLRQIDPQCAGVAVACARQYLGSSGFPGSALNIIKLTAARGEQKTTLAPDDVLSTLSNLTGLPTSILDSKERLDLRSVREFFASRVMGQDEAVGCVIDRIAMLKAGLSDPGRPIGVFLFAGPTGTGKTELAKTTAEYLFGSAERLIRLDMSEFQNADLSAFLGQGGMHGETESLIQRVRKQPFSVVLLDEFEKAHPRVWDLFLQVFDDGRLTDTVGQVADFRHCLIILTSNLGATTHQSSGFGFAAPADVFSADQVTRAISQTYRPEFQNRLDKVIVFRPLTRDLMRVILAKELKQILERRGLKDRAWAVEWEASALEFLLEKGFSPEMGARPLKRAIDQFVIAPLAATIVERRFPEGEQFVFFRSDGHSIQAEFVDPDEAADAPARAGDVGPGALTLPSMILAPAGSDAEFQVLVAEAAAVEHSLAAPEWEALKHGLSQAMSHEDFWSKPERYDTLSRLALMDRVAAAAATAQALRRRLERRARQSERYSRELVTRLALQLRLVKQGVQDALEGAAIEVALSVEPALETASGGGKETQAWCRRLWEMYRGWANRRHMQVDAMDLPGRGELPILVVAGFGAQRVLSAECGLHVLEGSDSGNLPHRTAARVRVVATPLQELPAAKMLDAITRALDKAPRPSALVRRYRDEPSPLVRNADGSWRSGKLDAVLRGDFDLLTAELI